MGISLLLYGFYEFFTRGFQNQVGFFPSSSGITYTKNEFRLHNIVKRKLQVYTSQFDLIFITIFRIYQFC